MSKQEPNHTSDKHSADKRYPRHIASVFFGNRGQSRTGIPFRAPELESGAFSCFATRLYIWSRHQDLNLKQPAYKAGPLPIEL